MQIGFNLYLKLVTVQKENAEACVLPFKVLRILKIIKNLFFEMWVVSLGKILLFRPFFAVHNLLDIKLNINLEFDLRLSHVSAILVSKYIWVLRHICSNLDFWFDLWWTEVVYKQEIKEQRLAIIEDENVYFCYVIN